MDADQLADAMEDAIHDALLFYKINDPDLLEQALSLLAERFEAIKEEYVGESSQEI